MGETEKMLNKNGNKTGGSYPRAVKIWLIVGLIMVVGQIVIGGITRLTESGLSITEWAVIQGTLPSRQRSAAVAGCSTFADCSEAACGVTVSVVARREERRRGAASSAAGALAAACSGWSAAGAACVDWSAAGAACVDWSAA